MVTVRVEFQPTSRTREDHVTSPEAFDTQAFFAAVDARRREEQLSWPALATVIWEQSRAERATLQPSH